MLSPWIYLMMNGLFFTLRLSGGSGSFPRPLKAAEEREYLERAAQGDLEARNLLVEHNLRLVAHIVKKYYAQTGDQDDLISIGTIGLIKGISTFKSDKRPSGYLRQPLHRKRDPDALPGAEKAGRGGVTGGQPGWR